MGTLNEDLSAIKTVEDTIIANKVAKFAYTDEAYAQNDANGVTEYNVNNAQNIPTADPSVLKVNDTVLLKGYRAQASSITRMLMNHFLGRLSYNVNKVNDGFSNLVATLIAHRGTANGFATLDASGRVPYSQLPESAMEYKGQWNAKTNTPTLANGTGTKGDFYIVSVAGTRNLGSGNIQFFVNDRVIYNGSVWSRLSAGDVKTVNNVLPTNGNVPLTGENIPVSTTDPTLLATFIARRGKANGFATLDASGRVPYSQLPESVMEYKGQWNAKTNTPTLANGTGTKGDFYIVSVAGTRNLGSGNIQFFVNDRVIYNGSVWSRLSAGDVKTVNNVLPTNGNVPLTGENIPVSTTDPTLLSAQLDTNRYKDASVTVKKVNFTFKDVMAKTPRWLRFDFSAGNKQTLKIAGDTHIRVENTVVHFDTDTSFDLSKTINAKANSNGKDWYVFLDTKGNITCSLSKVEATGTKRIGQFHTLCADAGARVTGLVHTDLTTTGIHFRIKQYNKEEDPDFYAFYKKPITAITTRTYYNVGTVAHPLSGFEADDILPESVWCLTFHPACASYDGMVYDRDCDIAVDIYLQSGKGKDTKSAFGATHTVARQQWNHEEDMRAVGKRLLKDHEFTSIASGSNEKTNIQGSSDKTTVGGHVDTAGRRMISFIGCEECCGYLNQWLDELCGTFSASNWDDNDGHGSFGQQYWDNYCLQAGGYWNAGTHCGSRNRNAGAVRSAVHGDLGSRGSAGVIRSA